MVSLERKENKFLDIMIDLCEEGEFSQIKRKIADVIGKYAKRVDGARA